MEPRTLAAAAHDHEIAHAEGERELRLSLTWAHEKATGVSEGHCRDDWIDDPDRNVIAGPGNRVTAVAVEVGPHGVERTLVTRHEQLADLLDDRRQRLDLLGRCPPRDQPRGDHDLAVELLSGRLPGSAVEQVFEQGIRPL